MGKYSRRGFLKKLGWVTAGAVTAPCLLDQVLASTTHQIKVRSEGGGDASSGLSDAVALEQIGSQYRAVLTDNGQALRNPDMGWTMHFYSNSLENYGSKLEPSDTLEDFPGLNGAYLRLPWALIEPEEGHFLWESLDTPAQRWIDQGLQVSFRISALEPWMYKATPQWVFDAGAKGFDAEGWVYEPDYDDPIYLEKVDHFVRAMAEHYDGSPHVAFVDIGHMGMWGEGHSVATTPKHGHAWTIETQKRIIDIYCRWFKKTQLCVSDDYGGPFLRAEHYPIIEYAFSKGVTLRDDSILVSKAPEQWYHDDMAQLFWPTMPVILEHEHYGLSKKRGNWDSELLVESVEAYHASYMSIHWWPREELAECREAIDRINRRIGYRLQMHKAVWPCEVKLGEPFEIESEWSNGGVAPCYKGGYPCFTLKDAWGGIVSVLVDDSLDVARLSVGKPDEVPKQPLKTACVVAPRFNVGERLFSRACAPGTYDLFVSVGRADGTPLYWLPYGADDGHRRYKIGQITLVEA